MGHGGVEKTLDHLNKANLHWRYMRKHVRQFIQQCPVCQKMRELRRNIKVHPFTTASYAPMEVLNIDTISPVEKDEFGNEYILVIIDCFTRWVELFPMVSNKGEFIAGSQIERVITASCTKKEAFY